MTDHELPPRKKSRFFPDGKNIKSSDTTEKTDSSIGTVTGAEVLSDQSNEKCRAVHSNIDQRLTNSVEETKSASTYPNAQMNLPDRSCRPSQRLSSNINDQPPSAQSALQERNLCLTENTKRRGPVSKDRRYGMYGVDGSNNTAPYVSNASLEQTAIDLDRDANGQLLPLHLRRLAPQRSEELPVGYSEPTRCTSANCYTSPKRVERVASEYSSSLKRKASTYDLLPPTHIYVRSNDPSFNVFSNGFLLYPELCFVLASHMQLRDLVNLYSVSKDFHTIIDSRFTTVCLSQALRKAPQSAQAYPFRLHAELCRDDPTARLPHPDPTKASLKIPRKIPSFRWVAFVIHREKVVHELMTVFAEKGCPLPARCSLALKKIWMLMDIPDNARRIALIHNHRVITNLDLYFSTCFFVKLDMVTNDPVASDKSDDMRKLLMSQRGGLDVVLKVLKRELWRKKSDFTLAWVETMVSMSSAAAEQLDAMGAASVFGIPGARVGIGKYEYWGLKGSIGRQSDQNWSYLLRPDQLVLREAVRRGLSLAEHYQKCILYGYIRPDTLENYAPRRYGRRIEGWEGEEYDVNDAVGGARALSVEDGGDVLLDLGSKNRSSTWTIEREAVDEKEQAMRRGQDGFLTSLYAVSEHEQQIKKG